MSIELFVPVLSCLAGIVVGASIIIAIYNYHGMCSSGKRGERNRLSLVIWEIDKYFTHVAMCSDEHAREDIESALRVKDIFTQKLLDKIKANE